MRNLIFFACLLLSGCQEKSRDIKIIWTNDRATAITIPGHVAQNIQEGSIEVRLVSQNNTVAMLGNFRMENDLIVFEPLVPFTRGLKYEVVVNGKRIGEITIPKAENDAPYVTQLYPTQDTVPENLLKIYIQFSKPMREGVSARHITLLKNNTDTVRGAFLDLQPELWNEDRTLLTVWLDPGRIKRDLIPNRTLGTPLQNGGQYILNIDSSWADTQGTALKKMFSKKFIAISRDSLSPDPNKWIVKPPLSGTTDPLNVNFNFPLDYSLVTTALQVQDSQGKPISGAWQVGEEEKSIHFVSGEEWNSGKYTLIVDTRLEDLAGNNISHAFDVDVRNKKADNTETSLITLFFYVR